MGNNFLVNDGIKRQKFNSVEIEKNISEHVLMVIISATTDFLSIKIDESERLLNISIKPFVGDFSLQNLDEEETITFMLPEYVEVHGYFLQNDNQKAYVIFRKLNNKQGHEFYY